MTSPCLSMTASALSSNRSSSCVVRTRFTTGALGSSLACVPKRSVESDSSKFSGDGEQQTMSTVRALPPSESCSSRVSLLSRYGMCSATALPGARIVGVDADPPTATDTGESGAPPSATDSPSPPPLAASRARAARCVCVASVEIPARGGGRAQGG